MRKTLNERKRYLKLLVLIENNMNKMQYNN